MLLQCDLVVTGSNCQTALLQKRRSVQYYLRQMARAVSARSRPLGSSVTTTVTVDDPPSQQQTLVLRLARSPSKVTWKEGTVDNEFLQRKSSKKCCIFHKQKSFDEDDSDDEDHKHEAGPSNKDDHVNGGGCCSKDSEAGGSVCHSGEE